MKISVNRRTKKSSAYLYILPTIALLCCVIFVPLIYALYISFFNIKGLNRTFIGLENYTTILSSNYFWSSVGRTLYFTIVSVALEFVLGMLAALLLSQDFKWRGVARALLIMPWALPTVVNGVLWTWIFDTNYGALNGLLAQMGLIDKYIAWLGKGFSALNCVIFADVWKNFPMMALILMAGLQTIDHTYYESAKIDGASAWQRFWKITLPIMKPSILVCLVLRTMEAFKVFDVIYTMTNGGPANGTQVISYYTYQTSFQYSKFGYGAALSYLVSLIIMAIAVVYIRLLGDKEDNA